MSGNEFAITPTGSATSVPVQPGDAPIYLQVQANGVDLGGPTVTTLNFVGFTSVARVGDTVTATL